MPRKQKKAKRPEAEPTILAFTSDWHVNSTIGLCPERVPLDDGGMYLPSPEQSWLLEKWREFWRYIGTLDGHRIAVVVGDVVESFHHGTVQLITLNEAVELEAALTIADVMLNAVHEVYVVRGTEAHTGGSGYKEELFAKRIGAVESQPGRFSSWNLACAWSQVRFDVSHHPRTASYVPQSRDWAAARQATYTVADYHEEDVSPPDVIVRGHCHYLGRGYHRNTFCVFLPPWLLTTAFGFRRGAGHRVEPPGGVVFRCEGGKYSWEPKTYDPPRRKPW